MKYQTVIGLEVHLQAKTNSKMFCSCSSDYFGKEANINICPVCFGLPGALPVPNEEAIRKCIKLSLALNCKINNNSKFDRKNYYYPDLPKGYQITQSDIPFGEDGYVEIEIGDDSRRIRIKRVHMEEDTAKSIHEGEDTLVDYNKSGTPLIEIVTEPDFQTVEEIAAFAKRLRQIIRYAEVSDAEMQKGQMRFELNMSLKTPDLAAHELPDYRIEVKNIGSISVLEKVIDFEYERQSIEIDNGKKMISQTRGLKNMSGETLLQRTKESADDYRYFPEPDIPPIKLDDTWINEIKESIKELPLERKTRYLELGLELEQADIFIEDTDRGDWFDLVCQEEGSNDTKIAKELSKWINSDIAGFVEKRKTSFEKMPLTTKDFLYLLNLLLENKITGTVVKKVIEIIFTTGKAGAEEIIKERNLLQITDESELEKFVDKVISDNEKVVKDIKKNPNAVKFLVGLVMRESRGKANPNTTEELLKEKLDL
ncbi:MAG: Asp-tRNA(Asn)/Glu-tRNA(Gln) amidotransferase subunit GatB [Candidatus Dojkabacteria bacterium]|nr:Asp-tRNA(Asn)/Glu-tRNA(Gln) amidotransferase subunit GatB [Candidatus Dojkabacteria bacterium]MDQ7021681.1 Asp-tRNA(Asn)/Glu-tRNA(Gln) amidotransferase subunit GatB [Candidatus Dojkabacteria bacterium]